ncbi:MAG: hypothetical protein H7Y18_02620 [Clostridiaceae bacterium]|nr:hypothetical protein [Clostridiaceae bacterium]
MEPTQRNPVRYMIILSMIFILILGVFISGYAIIMKGYYNSYESKLNIYIKAINKANNSTTAFMKEGTLDTQTAKSNIPNIINTLQKSKDNILLLNPTDKFKFCQAALIQGLTNNINIYAQLLTVLNNPEATDLSSSRNNMKTFKDACIGSYSQACIDKIKISLQKNTVDFIDSSIYYMDQLIKIKNNQGISDSQTTDFIGGVDESFKNFQVIKTDFKSYLYSLRNNNSNYDDLINKVFKNKTDLSKLKINLTKISVPQESKDHNPIHVFDLLKHAMNDYDLYLDSFTYALTNEKVQAALGKIEKDASDKLYIESDMKMSQVNKDYNDFIETYNSFKDIK